MTLQVVTCLSMSQSEDEYTPENKHPRVLGAGTIRQIIAVGGTRTHSFCTSANRLHHLANLKKEGSIAQINTPAFHHSELCGRPIPPLPPYSTKRKCIRVIGAYRAYRWDPI